MQWPAKLEVECHEALRNTNKCQGMSRNAEELKITSGNPKCLASGTISHITDAKQMFLTHGFNSSIQCRVTKKNAMLDSDFDFFKSNAEHMDATDPVHAMCFDSMRTTLGGL